MRESVDIDQHKIFRETVIKLCGNPDIHQALQEVTRYIKQFIPVYRMYIILFDPNMRCAQIISSVADDLQNESIGIKHLKIYSADRNKLLNELSTVLHCLLQVQISTNPNRRLPEKSFLSKCIGLLHTKYAMAYIVRYCSC
jgi:hypothetical protein